MNRIVSKLVAIFAVTICASSVNATPISSGDIVIANGKEWAQVDLFTGLSWNEMNNVCPAGICTNETLNGYSMEGWTWDTGNEAVALFNHYLGRDAFDNIGGRALGVAGVYAAVLADGWRETGGNLISGMGSAVPSIPGFSQFFPIGSMGLPGIYTSFNWNLGFNKQSGESTIGAWVYRDTISAVPVPATLALLGLGLAAAGFLSRRPGRKGS